jgi:hypothetical protein
MPGGFDEIAAELPDERLIGGIRSRCVSEGTGAHSQPDLARLALFERAIEPQRRLLEQEVRCRFQRSERESDIEYGAAFLSLQIDFKRRRSVALKPQVPFDHSLQVGDVDGVDFHGATDRFPCCDPASAGGRIADNIGDYNGGFVGRLTDNGFIRGVLAVAIEVEIDGVDES